MINKYRRSLSLAGEVLSFINPLELSSLMQLLYDIDRAECTFLLTRCHIMLVKAICTLAEYLFWYADSRSCFRSHFRRIYLCSSRRSQSTLSMSPAATILCKYRSYLSFAFSHTYSYYLPLHFIQFHNITLVKLKLNT